MPVPLRALARESLLLVEMLRVPVRLVAGLLLVKASLLFAQPLLLLDADPLQNYPRGEPIPKGQQIRRNEQVTDNYRRWVDRVMVQPYRAAHPDDREGSELLAATVTVLWRQGSAPRAQFLAAVDQRAADGSSDPILDLLAGVQANDPSRKEQYLRRAMTAFPATHYSTFLYFMAAANLAKTLSERHAAADEIAPIDLLALQSLADSLSASFTADETPALLWRLGSGSTTSLLKRRGRELATIFEQAANLPGWIRELKEGEAYLAAAWSARTDGWAHEVTEAGWQGWYLNLSRARQHLTRAWELNPNHPQAASEMIEVAMGEGAPKAELRQWFDRSVAAQLDYFDAYRAMIWALRPRWGGSHEEMLAFGDECLATERYDTCVPNYYFKVVQDVASEEPNPKNIYEQPEIIGKLNRTLERYLATPNTPLSETYGHTLAAILEYRRGDLIAARSHMAAIQYRPNSAIGPGVAEDIGPMMQALAAIH